MRIPKRNFVSHSLIFLIFSGFLFSSYSLSRAGSDTGENTSTGDVLNGRRASYAAIAPRLLRAFALRRASWRLLKAAPVWTEFAKSFDHDWEKYDKMQLAPMRDWAARELAKSISSGSTVFYPFSGPDFINPLHPFPRRRDLYPDSVGTDRRCPRFPGHEPEGLRFFFCEHPEVAPRFSEHRLLHQLTHAHRHGKQRTQRCSPLSSILHGEGKDPYPRCRVLVHGAGRNDSGSPTALRTASPVHQAAFREYGLSLKAQAHRGISPRHSTTFG